jgi:hypothetical protein
MYLVEKNVEKRFEEKRSFLFAPETIVVEGTA